MLSDKRIDVWECPECGERETCDFMCDCCYPAPEAKPRTFVAVDALMAAFEAERDEQIPKNTDNANAMHYAMDVLRDLVDAKSEKES